MKKTILEIYALAVCFATIVCLVISLGIAGYSIIRINKPHFTIDSYRYDRYQSNDAFWENCHNEYCSENQNKEARPSEDDLTKKRTEAFALALASEQRDAYQTLVKSLIVILVDSIAFLIHWSIARKARISSSK